MGTQTLQTNIIINARTGNGFSRVGNTLTELGSLVNGFSQELIGLGKESIQVYRSYEKSLKSAEVALSTTYGRDTAELAKVMKQLDASATDWAATTIFHTNDVGNAIDQAAHAGWDLQEILEGLPAAMQLAQAGGLDLSEAVNYIVKSTSAAGIGFENLTDSTDLWTFASNRSASNIREFGDAMLRMGSTMRFTGSTEELMTLIAVTANAGAVGTEAGTMIRNSIIRLVAPTDKAEKAMAQLGAASQETIGLLEDEELAAANAILARQGFSAYDERGNLKNILDIYQQLYVALGQIAGGYDSIERNQDAISILSSIFPTRTITEALTLLRGAADSYDGLYESMKSGAAEGYGAYAAETMMDSLDGRIEIFDSKVERLKQVIGAELKDDVINWTDALGGVVDGIADLDPAVFSGLVKGAEVLAGLGPGLLAAGGAMRLIGMMTPVGWAALGGIAAAVGGTYLADYKNSIFGNNFGSMELDQGKIKSYISSISEELRGAYAESNRFRDAVNGAMEDYTAASGNLSSTLMTNMLTRSTITTSDQREMERMADEMYRSLTEAISNSTAASDSFWSTLLSNGGYEEVLQQIIDLTDSSGRGALEEAGKLSEKIRAAMTSAFADGKLTQEEYQNIMSYMQDYNDAMARAAAEAKSEEDYIKQRKLLHKAQTASLDDVESIIQEAVSQRDEVAAEQEEQYLTERYKLEYRWDQAIAKGEYINGVLATEEGKQEALGKVNAAWEAQKAKTNKDYDRLMLDLYETAMAQSDLSQDQKELSDLAGKFRSGEYSAEVAHNMVSALFGDSYANMHRGLIGKWLSPNKADKLSDASLALWRAFGGQEQVGNGGLGVDEYGISRVGDIEERIQAYLQSGDTELAARLQDFYLEQVLLRYGDKVYGMGTEFSEAISGHENALGLNRPATPTNAEGSMQVIPGIYPAESEVIVTGDTEPLDRAIEERDGSEISVVVNGVFGTILGNIKSTILGYAEGGRATEPSIFGEAGAEWAIPEEHSERTAELLNAARAASGWSWPDLLARFGGLNADATHMPGTLIYSPTINATDVTGVEEALREDKKRLDKWFRERKMREAAEVWA